ncbi:hypothetical protein [Thermofilum sp.]|jgi:uncharacterized sporulation protein YeaH/YhbH (DUF444 family)|uniref:hypothetical protein n=1 Tax=Thermofilum sp. TaxID=1961369 RepID=UPI00258631FB|nr:hypothetical protein [Thermofilum sp.]
MSKYTTIRVSLEDKQRLERLAKLAGKKSIAEALRFALTIAEKELEQSKTIPSKVLSSLAYARDIGETNAEKVDEYIYGAEK